MTPVGTESGLRPRRPETGGRATLFLLLLALGGLPAAVPLAGQAGAHPPSTPSSLRHIQEVEPRTGPTGTRVRIYTQNMPPQGRVLVGVGAIGVGFEVLSEGEQGQWGDVRAELQIPGSAGWDRPVRVIFLNGLFSPIGLSDPFHVTDSRGLIRRTGRVGERRGECLPLEDDNGDTYALLGSTDGLRTGQEVAVEGRWSESGSCDGEGTIQVLRVGEPSADRLRPPPG